MKKITFLFTLLTISLSFGQNLLTGGDLEGLATGKIIPGSSPWDTSVANSNFQSSVNSNSAVAYAGDQFLNMPNDFTNVRQSITAVASTTYIVSVWYQFVMGQGTPDATDGIYVSIRQDTGGNGTQFGTPIQIYIDPSTVDGSWHEATFEFTAPQTDLLFFITKQTRAVNTNPNNAARMDNLSITEKTLSIADLVQFNFKSYPNPAKDIINLSAAKNIDKIEIYTLLGQQVKSIPLNSNSAKVNVSGLSKGVYLVKTFIEDAVGTYKFVKE
jgi:hypothetical protein